MQAMPSREPSRWRTAGRRSDAATADLVCPDLPTGRNGVPTISQILSSLQADEEGLMPTELAED